MEKSGKIYKILPYVILSLAVCILFSYLTFGDIQSVSLTVPANNSWYSNGSWNADGARSEGSTVNVTFNCSAITNLGEATGNISLWLGTSAATFGLNQTNTTDTANNTGYLFNVTNMPDGAYIWGCEAYNISGTGRNVSSNYTLYVDTAKPHTISLSQPSQGTNTTSTTRDFNWTAMDNLATNFLCNLTLDNVIGNKTIMVSNGSLNNTQVTSIPDGTHYWNVTCWDPTNSSSNTNTSETFRFTVDTAVPAVAATRPENKTYNTNQSIPINFTVTDVSTLVSGCYYSLDNAAYVALASCANTIINVSENAAHSIQLFANDTVNNTNASVIVNFASDISTTNITALNLPADGNISSIRNVTFNWTVTDSLDLNISCNITIDGSYNLTNGYGVANGTSGLVTVNNLAEGLHWWNVSCWDDAGNRNVSATRNFTVDLSDPVVNLLGIANATWLTTGTSIILNASVTDATLKSCRLDGDFNGTWHTNNQTIAATSGSVNNFAGLNLSQGNYTWNVWCNDSAGHTAVNATNYTFYVDLTNPNATATVSASAITQLQSVTVTCDGVDSQSAVTNTFVSVLTPGGTTVTSPSNPFLDTLNTGTYTVRCRSTDLAGRTTEVTATFAVSPASSSGSSSSPSGVLILGESHTMMLTAALPVTILASNAAKAGITSLVIESLVDAANVKFTIGKLSVKPLSITALPSGEAYSYVQIDAPLAAGKIKRAKIRFDVLKSWMEAKGVKSEEIVMQHYGTEWKDLPTVLVKEDSQKASYEATTTSFSTFAITAKAAVEEAPKEEPVEQKPVEEKPVEEAAPPAETPVIVEKTAIGPYIAAIVAILCIGGAVAFIIIRKRKK